MTDSLESYKHLAAKQVLAGWLRRAAGAAGPDAYASWAGVTWRVNRPAPDFGVWEEYPLTTQLLRAGSVSAWDERGEAAPPTYRTLIGRDEPPLCIFDVAVQHKGLVTYAFEVVHQHPVTDTKRSILAALDVCTLVLSAEWIMRQVGPPRRLAVAEVLGLRALFPGW